MIREKSKANILLVEDDLDLADAIVSFFRQREISVIHRANPIQALEAAGELELDAIITDLNMPQMSGLDLIKALSKRRILLPIILITAADNLDTATEAIEAGAYDFVVKPIHFQQLHVSLHRALRLKKVNAENATLRNAIEVSRGLNPEGVIGFSPAFKKAFDLAKRVSKSHSTVFIFGESGSGKEVFARAIHHWGPRKNKPFIAINCSAIPDNLLESELFGHAKGSFTGAIDKKVGLFEEANGGTIFLDEIGDMNFQLQAKLLRVIQERKVKRVGETQLRDIDVRIITATHKDLKHEVAEKQFREDLFFRLNVIPIRIPSLRQRREDILPLANFFLSKFNAINGTEIKGFSNEAIDFLLKNEWKGNVRELENTIERAVVLCQGTEIDMDSFLLYNEKEIEPSPIEFDPKNLFAFKIEENPPSLREIENKYIQYIFQKNNQVRELTARVLDIDRKTLYKKLQSINASAQH